MGGEPGVPYPYGRSVPACEEPDLRTLLHRLNNQLGIILANAELLETRLGDDPGRSRAKEIVTGAVDAIATARDIRSRVVAARSREPEYTTAFPRDRWNPGQESGS